MIITLGGLAGTGTTTTAELLSEKLDIPLHRVDFVKEYWDFVFTYFCGAVYDGRIYGKIQMAVASLFYIEQMLMARFVKNEGHLYEDDILSIVYRYSREVEHSDENLERLEKLMEKEVWLCANRQ